MGELQEWISSTYSNISLKCKFFTTACAWLCTRHDLRSYEVMTALLRTPPSPPPFPPVVIKMRDDWEGGGGGGCPLLVLSPRMHLNNKTFSYWQLGLGGRQSGGLLQRSSWSIILSSPKVQMKWLKLRLCKRKEAHSSSCWTLGGFISHARHGQKTSRRHPVCRSERSEHSL